MNNEQESFGKEIAKKYAKALGIFFGALLVIVVLAYLYLQQYVWFADQATGQFLSWVHNNIVFLIIICFLLGCLGITFFFAYRLMMHIGKEVSGAAKQIVNEPETTVVLSGMLKPVQDELNEARVQFVRNAYVAKEAEKRKNDLIVYLAHDLKTPLTSVIGYLALLQEQPDLPVDLRSRYTGIALEKAERLENLINEFFEITRFNLTTMTLEKETINLSLMLAQIASEFEPVLAEKNLTCKAEIEPDIKVCCDTEKWERVIDNLFRNAIHYSFPETEITLTLKQLDNLACMKISNRGKTIPKDKQERIFEQFFRLDSARDSSTGGAGLGLAITKEIVTLHGGDISVESENEVTTFTVNLKTVINL